MERDGEIHLEWLLAQLANSRNESHRRNRHVPRAQVEAIGTIEDTQRLQDIIVVMQRLAHAHQDDVGNAINRRAARQTFRCPGSGPQLTRKVEYLRDDLSRAQMTIKAHLTRRAKCAAVGAARL